MKFPPPNWENNLIYVILFSLVIPFVAFLGDFVVLIKSLTNNQELALLIESAYVFFKEHEEVFISILTLIFVSPLFFYKRKKYKTRSNENYSLYCDISKQKRVLATLICQHSKRIIDNEAVFSKSVSQSYMQSGVASKKNIIGIRNDFRARDRENFIICLREVIEVTKNIVDKSLEMRWGCQLNSRVVVKLVVENNESIESMGQQTIICKRRLKHFRVDDTLTDNLTRDYLLNRGEKDIKNHYVASSTALLESVLSDNKCFFSNNTSSSDMPSGYMAGPEALEGDDSAKICVPVFVDYQGRKRHLVAFIAVLVDNKDHRKFFDEEDSSCAPILPVLKETAIYLSMLCESSMNSKKRIFALCSNRLSAPEGVVSDRRAEPEEVE
ncbi:MAG: hypothetical protein ACRBBR_04690 [Cellvibrionaceae bacterium]